MLGDTGLQHGRVSTLLWISILLISASAVRTIVPWYYNMFCLVVAALGFPARFFEEIEGQFFLESWKAIGWFKGLAPKIVFTVMALDLRSYEYYFGHFKSRLIAKG